MEKDLKGATKIVSFGPDLTPWLADGATVVDWSATPSVSEDYHVPFKFTGDLKKVTIDLTPEKLSAEDDQKLKAGEAAIGVSE